MHSPLGDERNDPDEYPVYLQSQQVTQDEPKERDFQSLVGILLWFASCTRHDVSYAVHKATQHTYKPTISYWKLAKWIFRYLKETKQLKLEMKISKNGDNVSTTSWSDSDFAAEKSYLHSVTVGVIKTDGAAGQWICKKQTGVLLSSMEDKFTSASHVGRKLLEIRELLQEIDQTVCKPMLMFMDNQAAIRQLESKESMSSSKHVDVRVKFICDY